MIRKFAIATTMTAAAAVIGVLALSTGAQAKSTSQCIGSSRAAVIKCCDQITREHKPLWMLQTNSSCAAAAQCSVKTIPGTSITHVTKPKKIMVCGIVPPKAHDKGDPQTNPQPKPNRDPNGNPNDNFPGKP